MHSFHFCISVTKRIIRSKVQQPRLTTLTKIKTLDKKIIDEGLIVYFPKKQSFTGEEVAEFHIHGSTAIIDKLLKELGKIRGLRPAKQGEFTKQAYLNGKKITEQQDRADAHPYGLRPFKRLNYINKFLTLTENIIDKKESDRFLKIVQNLRKLKSGKLDQLNIEIKKSKLKKNLKKGIF